MKKLNGLKNKISLTEMTLDSKKANSVLGGRRRPGSEQISNFKDEHGHPDIDFYDENGCFTGRHWEVSRTMIHD